RLDTKLATTRGGRGRSMPVGAAEVRRRRLIHSQLACFPCPFSAARSRIKMSRFSALGPGIGQTIGFDDKDRLARVSITAHPGPEFVRPWGRTAQSMRYPTHVDSVTASPGRLS